MKKTEPTGIPGVLNVEVDGPRVVTPTNPLVINSTPAVFEAVWIEGGDVIVQVRADVTFNELKKVS